MDSDTDRDPLDGMLLQEDDTLRERVADLERKVHDQNDEIVVLRSTLADVVRRLALLEATRVPIVNHVRPLKENSFVGVRRAVAPPSSLPTSGSMVPPPGQITAYTPVNNRSRPPQYQSNTSLHSDGQTSSSSASPIPSPSPSQTSVRSSPSPRHTPSPNHKTIPEHHTNNHYSDTNHYNNNNSYHNHTTTPSTATTPMKKWSSSLDCSQRQLSHNRSGSLMNLTTRSASSLSLRHSTKDAIYNSEEGYVKLYIRGRPLILYVPTPLLSEYTLTKVLSLPNERLRVDWVYGYRGRDCRSNIYYLPTGELLYFIAAIVVLYNVDEQMQRHYLGHTDDVKCVCVHPNRLLVASGQMAGHGQESKPHIRVWDSVSLNTVHVIGMGEFDRSIACLAFSKLDGGSLLCAVDEASEHNMTVWEWNKGERGIKVMETKSSTDPVLAVEFHPMDRNRIVTCGKNHVNFWSADGNVLTKSMGIFDMKRKPKFVLCIAFTDLGDTLTGDSNGNILVWERGSCRVSRVISNAHDGPVFSICSLKDGSFLSGGGRDRCIREWDSSLHRTDNEIELPPNVGPVRTLAQGKGGFIVVGTTRNCILQGTFSVGFHTVVQGHTDELWGLAIHPNQQQFVTCGHDRSVHLWDSMSHSVVWSTDITDPVVSGCFSPDGSVLVVATAVGRWLAMDASTREVLTVNVDGNEPIDVIKFSPDGNYLAIGSRNNLIIIYQVSDEYRRYSRIGRCLRDDMRRKSLPQYLGHSSFITHLDWSSDGNFVQSNSGDLELLYWNAPVCRQITSTSQMRDVQWHTQTCTLGFSVMGIWSEGMDGTDINAVCRSHNNALLAAGDDNGKVRLLSYPTCHPKVVNHSYNGHSSHVTAVGFLPDDTRLITLGGNDCSIIQWHVLS